LPLLELCLDEPDACGRFISSRIRSRLAIGRWPEAICYLFDGNAIKQAQRRTPGGPLLSGESIDGSSDTRRRPSSRGQLNAPPHTNRILVVSTCRNSCCGCLRPPCGGTLAINAEANLPRGGDRPMSNRGLRCRETEFLGQRQSGRNGCEGSRTPLRTPNLAKQCRQFGAIRRELGNLR
jgi:hypothetical protein